MCDIFLHLDESLCVLESGYKAGSVAGIFNKFLIFDFCAPKFAPFLFFFFDCEIGLDRIFFWLLPYLSLHDF